MSALLVLAVAYAGIGGKGAAKVDAQVRSMIAKQSEVVDTEVSRSDRHALVTHAARAGAIVARVDAKSLVAGEVDRRGKNLTVVVYGSDGAMVDLIELPLHRKKLAASDLASLHDTVVPDVERLEGERSPSTRVAADDENPVDTDKTADDPSAIVTASSGASPRRRAPVVRVSFGVGPRTRSFAPGPSMANGYRSDPIAGGELDLEVTPTRWAAVGGEIDRTLAMSTTLPTGKTATTMLRWRATGALVLPLGALDVAIVGGFGGRDFVIGAAAPTPDDHYLYAIAGGRIGVRLGRRVAIHALGAFEPVVGGVEHLDMPSGAPSRAGLELSGSIDVTATAHWTVSGAAGYQRFTWTWKEGTAVDEYPAATLSLGAAY